MFHEVWIIREVMVLTVLEDEDSIVFQQSAFEDETGNGGEFFQGIGRIGEDEVVLLLARLDVAEDIATEGDYLFSVPKFLQTLLDETMMVAIEFDTDDMATATRKQFESDAACAREEIQRLGSLEIDILCEHIEDILLREIRCRPRFERAWNVEVTSFVFPGNDSHRPFTKSVIRS